MHLVIFRRLRPHFRSPIDPTLRKLDLERKLAFRKPDLEGKPKVRSDKCLVRLANPILSLSERDLTIDDMYKYIYILRNMFMLREDYSDGRRQPLR